MIEKIKEIRATLFPFAVQKTQISNPDAIGAYQVGVTSGADHPLNLTYQPRGASRVFHDRNRKESTP